ncbi:pyruvate, phosphate dikinase [Pararhizobium mangrovi]|uniref:Pyruvate, phosphate dikinase n=1 Tax=Pararhizobium mangrovi TaxID=2590452 RepID=A0A506U8H3_9HYPH|nr:pyruvate, phosphate dikinase [Pararhizobium mangrovi]TPW30653.1 pyruvate, phosphate dikinase [Pararhizobium mangrovi]
MTKLIYAFGRGRAEGDARQTALLGGKGAALAEMSRIGLPVPPGLTLTSDVCRQFYEGGHVLPAGLMGQVKAGLATLGAQTGQRFAGTTAPLLLSVRSGAARSMPGMLDTVLNIGLNDETVVALGANSGDPRFAFDSYRRLLQRYGDTVMGVDQGVFEEIVREACHDAGVESEAGLAASALKSLVARFKAAIEAEAGMPFPQDAHTQLSGAISAVLSSWMSSRAIAYRRLNDIPEMPGTAVTLQAMVFGNRGRHSATGVAFTRDPSTGERRLYGEYLPGAQGEDVVAGTHTPLALTDAAPSSAERPAGRSLARAMPETFKAFAAACDRLERHYRDVQEVEFTIEEGRLWILQTRRAKRTAQAGLRIAVEMVDEGLINEREAVSRVDPASLEHLLHPMVDPNGAVDVVAAGLPASPGAAAGEIVFTSEEAMARAAKGIATVLVRPETSPDDIRGMNAAEAILTTRGGMTSHAAVIARGMGKPCVTGAASLRLDVEAGRLTGGGFDLKAGDIVTLDGSGGRVLAGTVEMIKPEPSGAFARLLGWADTIRRLRVRGNAETPADARAAHRFGAEGIGLCRTEHMVFEGERARLMREVILAPDEAGRRASLAELLPLQRADFVELFEIMQGQPVTIRLLDPPLHEFLPGSEEEITEVARGMRVPAERLRRRIAELGESNPMLGHRGCRLAISYPEIAEMQAQAILEAATEAAARTGAPVVPEIMVPLVSLRRELDFVKARVDAVAEAVAVQTGIRVEYLVGTMIELPRAALRADAIAETAEFFSFGTNDLTQTTLGISRDDSAAFLPDYLREGIIERDPFVTIDVDGVGDLMRMASERGRAVRPELRLGISGEHGGDPASIRFCEEIGLDYVSCSPYRVPIARLAAAQSAIAAEAARLSHKDV